MPKRKNHLGVAQWEAHDKDTYLKALSRDQASESAPWQGERFAMAVNCKTKAELTEMMERTEDEIGLDLLEFITAAQDSLKQRLELVDCAFARLATVAVNIKDKDERVSATA